MDSFLPQSHRGLPPMLRPPTPSESFPAASLETVRGVARGREARRCRRCRASAGRAAAPAVVSASASRPPAWPWAACGARCRPRALPPRPILPILSPPMAVAHVGLWTPRALHPAPAGWLAPRPSPDSTNRAQCRTGRRSCRSARAMVPACPSLAATHAPGTGQPPSPALPATSRDSCAARAAHPKNSWWFPPQPASAPRHIAAA